MDKKLTLVFVLYFLLQWFPKTRKNGTIHKQCDASCVQCCFFLTFTIYNSVLF